MHLGVQGLMPRDLSTASEETVESIRAHGFTGVACRIFEPMKASKEDVTRLRDVLNHGGVDPCQAVAQHPDLIDPDPLRRATGIKAMQHMCKVTRWLEAGNLYLRPGSVSPRGSWYPHPDNFKPETFETLIDSAKQVCAAAASEGVVLAVEGHVLSILNTPERVKDLIDAVGSDSLRFNQDPVNFIGSLQDAYDTTSVIERLFEVLGPYTVCGHAKDFIVQDRLVLHIEETVIGEGVLDQETYLKLFEQYCPDGYVQIEHLPAEKIPEARAEFYQAGLNAKIKWKRLES